VRARTDEMVPLSSLVQVSERVAPRELNHFGQRRSVTISANLAPDYALGEALEWMDDTAARILPPGYSTDYDGQSREFKTSLERASRWSSCSRSPSSTWCWQRSSRASSTRFIIMLTVPLSMTGALAR
jgi:multidrug efflux pump